MAVKEFLALPDRERDAVVAEKAMGCQVYGSYADRHTAMVERVHHFPDVTWSDGDESFHLNGFRPGVMYTDWSPTKDMFAAWQVVAHVKATPKPVNALEHARILVTVTETVDHSACSVEMWFNTYYHREGPDKAPLAICIAALLAVGALVEGTGDQK